MTGLQILSRLKLPGDPDLCNADDVLFVSRSGSAVQQLIDGTKSLCSGSVSHHQHDLHSNRVVNRWGRGRAWYVEGQLLPSFQSSSWRCLSWTWPVSLN